MNYPPAKAGGFPPKAYKYRITPNKEQEVLLSKHFGHCRFVYNHFLQIKIQWVAFIPSAKADGFFCSLQDKMSIYCI